ncbi:hypothetical protein EV702DRAFT_417170 [Suillus placidus]|uniref:Uncharacterized protein n=1 Tax=Suillus placidus TaxID=48579 RepID=A0A9P6ZT63_9AGAM|nr:hypothetical protein EV702DRAFT_417170 [Suillus placidus]
MMRRPLGKCITSCTLSAWPFIVLRGMTAGVSCFLLVRKDMVGAGGLKYADPCGYLKSLRSKHQQSAGVWIGGEEVEHLFVQTVFLGSTRVRNWTISMVVTTFDGDSHLFSTSDVSSGLCSSSKYSNLQRVCRPRSMPSPDAVFGSLLAVVFLFFVLMNPSLIPAPCVARTNHIRTK